MQSVRTKIQPQIFQTIIGSIPYTFGNISKLHKKALEQYPNT